MLKRWRPDAGSISARSGRRNSSGHGGHRNSKTMLDTANVAAYERMSPSLLASQPPSVPQRDARPDLDWDTTFSYLEFRLGMLRAWRYSWWAFWAVLAR